MPESEVAEQAQSEQVEETTEETETILDEKTQSIVDELKPKKVESKEEGKPLKEEDKPKEEEKKEEEKKDDSRSRLLLKVAERERKALEMETNAKAQLARMQDKMRLAEEFDALRSKAQTDPVSLLEKLGVDFGKLANDYLAKDDPVKQLQRQVEALKAEQLGKEKERQTQIETAQLQYAENVFKQAVTADIASGNYPILEDEPDIEQEVMNVFKLLHERGENPTREQCLKITSDYFENLYEKKIPKLQKLGKFKEVSAPQAEKQQPTVQKATKQDNGKTLLNKHAGIKPDAKKRTLSEEEMLSLAAEELRKSFQRE